MSAVDDVIADWYAGRSERDPYDEIGTLVAEVERLRKLAAPLPCRCGKPLAHIYADPDSSDWACRVPTN